jgi:hypothetical protein
MTDDADENLRTAPASIVSTAPESTVTADLISVTEPAPGQRTFPKIAPLAFCIMLV